MILQRYILRQVVLSFVFAFAVIMGVFLVAMCFQTIRSYSSVGLGTLLRILPLVACNAASWAVFVSTCPAMTVVYGRLSADNEIDAMRISGIATRRMVTPALLFSLLVCAGTYGVVEGLAPDANYARRMLIREFSLELLRTPPPGKQHFPFGQFELSYLDASGGVLQLPYLIKYANGKPELEYTAVSGRVVLAEGRNPQLILSRPTAIEHDASGRVTLGSAMNDVPVELPLEEFFLADRRPDNMHLRELWSAAHREPKTGRRNWYLTVFWSRFAQSAAPFFLVLVSVPIGILVRRGSRLAGLGAALPPFLLYIVTYFIFQGMGENGRLPPWAAGFAPDATLFVLGSWLLWSVCRK